MEKLEATKKRHCLPEIPRLYVRSVEPITKILSSSSSPVTESSERMENSSDMVAGSNARNGSSNMKNRNNNSPKVRGIFCKPLLFDIILTLISPSCSNPNISLSFRKNSASNHSKLNLYSFSRPNDRRFHLSLDIAKNGPVTSMRIRYEISSKSRNEKKISIKRK